MRKAILIIAGVLCALVLVAVVVVAMQPSEYRVTRKATIPSPPAVVFAQVNNLQKWPAWSPWEKLDPNVKNTFEGPAAGEGAKFHWAGNDQVGEGTMTITESRPDEFIKMLLEFRKPMEGNSDVTFDFQPADGGQATEVTWAMVGKNGFVGKAMCMFMDMDAMLGKSFEEGFQNLTVVAEKAETAVATPSTEAPATEPTTAESAAEAAG